MIAFGHHDAELAEGATSDTLLLRPPRDVVVVEVGPRDGLQNETSSIPTWVKIAFVDALTDAGLPIIEVTSFVNPKAVPQLADAGEVMTGIRRANGTRYSVLVPNERGFERALEARSDAIALFTSATEAFAQANVGTSIDGTFERFEPVAVKAKHRGLWVRGYVSVAFGCPYSGTVDTRAVVRVAERLLQLGCDEVCLADTIGTATPESVIDTMRAAQASIPLQRLALHFHDTSGTALANVERALDLGVRIFDSAAGGLGGCPFAPGAPGNLATEQLVRHMNALGVRTGVELEAVAAALKLVRPYIPRLGRLTA
ncbi:MAG TPA: hydroxymethylglutaryl-CoA lyase [Thermomicrobiales bacterium]|nr:hydroxymethylglutaryl-CoA lyase [Thermomicrobiales bacterium]